MMQAAQLASVRSQLVKFMAAQTERALAYTKFERGFATHLIGGPLTDYEALCAEVTVAFSDCSNQVKAVSDALRTGIPPRPDLANILKNIQNEERKKLQLTAQLQVFRQDRKSIESPSDKSTLATLDSELGMQSVNTFYVDGGELYHSDSQSRSSLDCMCKIQVATKALQETIDTINEYIEEIRYELEDLEELNELAL